MPRIVVDEDAVYELMRIYFVRARGPGALLAPDLLASQMRGQDGLSMIEVVVSAMIVALIAMATLTGFSNAGRATGQERAHAQAAACAQQNQERLRGMTVTQLGAMGTTTEQESENCQPYKAGQTGTIFAVTSEATPYTETSSGAVETCTTENGEINYLRTTTSVTSNALGPNRAAVTQSSIVTTPLSASLIVKVHNQNEEPVEGASVKATVGSSIYTQTTGSGGCAIYTSLASNTATVEVTKTGWVNEAGQSNPTKTVKVSGDAATTIQFNIGLAGHITANFVDNTTKVKYGDTFVAYHNGIGSTNPYDLAGTIGTYANAVTSATILYPFVSVGKPPGKSEYAVYAGDCARNNPENWTTTVKSQAVQINPGETPTVNVLVPPVNIVVYEGTSTSPGKLLASSTSKATLTDSSCSGVLPANYTTAPTYARTQKLNVEGHLEFPNQPFGEYALCVSGTVGTKTRRWKTTLTNNTATGPSVAVDNGGTTTLSGTTYGLIYLSATGTEEGSC